MVECVLLVAVLDVHGEEDAGQHNAAHREDGDDDEKREAHARWQDAAKGAVHGRSSACTRPVSNITKQAKRKVSCDDDH